MKMAALALVPPTSCCQSYFETYVFMRLLVRHNAVLLERPLRQVRAQRSEREVMSLWPTAPVGRDICVMCASVCGLRSLVPSGATSPRQGPKASRVASRVFSYELCIGPLGQLHTPRPLQTPFLAGSPQRQCGRRPLRSPRARAARGPRASTPRSCSVPPLAHRLVAHLAGSAHVDGERAPVVDELHVARATCAIA